MRVTAVRALMRARTIYKPLMSCDERRNQICKQTHASMNSTCGGFAVAAQTWKSKRVGEKRIRNRAASVTTAGSPGELTDCFFKNWPHVIYSIQAFEAPTKRQEGRAKGLNWLAREVAA